MITLFFIHRNKVFLFSEIFLLFLNWRLILNPWKQCLFPERVFVRIEVGDEMKENDIRSESKGVMPRIILASGSPRRLELMHQAGFSVEVIPSHADEKVSSGTPDEVVRCLSRRKAEDVAGEILNPDKSQLSAGGGEDLRNARLSAEDNDPCIILGADTIVARDANILGKPSSPEEAVETLRSLSGRSHDVYTGVTLVKVEKGEIQREETFSVRTRVYVCELTDREIREYVETGDPMDKAGSYGIQGIFARYIEKIEGDYYNVVGLPVSTVYHKLEEWGVSRE